MSNEREIRTSTLDDENPYILRYMHGADHTLMEVSVWIGHDGTPVVQIDTGDLSRVRVNLNEGIVWDGNPETDALPGANYGESVLCS